MPKPHLFSHGLVRSLHVGTDCFVGLLYIRTHLLHLVMQGIHRDFDSLEFGNKKVLGDVSEGFEDVFVAHGVIIRQLTEKGLGVFEEEEVPEDGGGKEEGVDAI